MNYNQYASDNFNEAYDLLKKLCQIPAPSGMEEKRAEFIKEYLEKIGATGVYIDEAKNVIYPLNCENSDKITVFAAHTDTVFPDLSPMPMREENGRFYCPASGDDTASVAVLLIAIKYFLLNSIKPENGVLFVFNSCEEGLGNLKGTKTLFKNFVGRIKEFISLDNSVLNGCCNECIGSHRYRVKIKAQGGHSFNKFGNTNAIYELSKVINSIYSVEVPEKAGTVTTYNVGVISGGTTVNTIPQYAEMLCEYRSNDTECLDIMKNNFQKIFSAIDKAGVSSEIELIGDRPCGTAEMKQKSDYLCKILENVIKEVLNRDIEYEKGSTDSNVPISLGVPAITFGVCEGEGCHTREEYIVIDSLKKGIIIALKFMKELLGF